MTRYPAWSETERTKLIKKLHKRESINTQIKGLHKLGYESSEIRNFLNVPESQVKEIIRKKRRR